MALCFNRGIGATYKHVQMRMFSKYLGEVTSATQMSFQVKQLSSQSTGLKNAFLKTKSFNVLGSSILKRNFYATTHAFSSQSINNENIQSFNEDEFRLIYEGPLSKKIKMLKFFSLSTATMSVVAGPTILFMGRASISLFAKLFLASTVVTMGVTTTILLHWLTRVYVYKMYFHPQTRTFAAETSSLFGGVRRSEFSVEDVVLPEVEAAFSTFEARGNRYFIHMDLKEAEQILKYVKEYNLETL